MPNIPIRDLTQSGTPSASSQIVFDDGTMKRGTVGSMADAVRPAASQGEAQAGSDNAKVMTPLRVKESIASELGVSIQPYDSDLTAFAAKTAPTGAVVGTTDTQTLTNKTLNSPAISSPTGMVKGDVGLGNVDNTSDATKNAASATLTNKTLDSPAFTGAATGTGVIPSSLLQSTGVTPGSYTSANITVNAQGQVTIASNGSGGGSSNQKFYSVLDYGAVADARTVTDGAMSSGSSTFTSATASFSGADVGKSISVAGAGAAGATLMTTISAYTNSTTVTLASPNASGGAISAKRATIGTNNSTAFAAAISAASSNGLGGGQIVIPNGSYLFATSITLPQNRFIRFTGEGVRSTTLFCGPDAVALFSYIRGSGQAGAIYEFEDLNIQLASMSKAVNSAGILSFGFSDAAADNYIRVRRCWFYGFYAAISGKWTGQTKVNECFFSGNRYSVYLQRGASFWDFFQCMSFDGTFIYAQDTTYDAYSNGMIIIDCHHVTGANESVYVEGWQAVYMRECGWDLGSGGTAAVWLKQTTDYTITSCYISSNDSVTRAGVLSDQCVKGHISQSTIVGNSIGVHVYGANGVATRVTTFDNTFNGNATNDLVWNTYSTACKHTSNHHSKAFVRSGTTAEIYGNITGVDKNLIVHNTFRGAAYAPSVGAGSYSGQNIFDCPAG